MHKSKADGADRESLNTPDSYEISQYLRNQDRAPAETPVLCEFDSWETSQSVNQGGVVQYKDGTADIPKSHDLSLEEISQPDEPDQNFNSQNYPMASGSQYLSRGGLSGPVYQWNVSTHSGPYLMHGGSAVMNRIPNSYEAMQYSRSSDTPYSDILSLQDKSYSLTEASCSVDQASSRSDLSNPERNVSTHSGPYLMHGGSTMARQDLRSNRMGARSQPSLESQQGPIYVGGDGKWTPLHDALTGNKKNVRILLRKRKDIKDLLVRDSKGGYLSQQEMETLLRRVEFDVNARNNEGKTMLHLLGNGDNDVNIISPLLQLSEADISIRDNEGRTPLLSAICLPKKMLALLEGRRVDVNTQDDEGKTLLHHAAYSQSNPVIRILLEKGADINAQDREKRTPLHLSIEKYNPFRHPSHRSFDALLKVDGINVNIQDNEGKTLLHDVILLSTTNSDHMFTALLEVDGINVNIQDNEGKTPLHLLANKKTNGLELQPHVKMVEGLLEKDRTSVNIKDNSGETPVCYATLQRSSKIAGLLQAAMQKPYGNMNNVNVENLYEPGMGR